jgi:hypothetical protein
VKKIYFILCLFSCFHASQAQWTYRPSAGAASRASGGTTSSWSGNPWTNPAGMYSENKEETGIISAMTEIRYGLDGLAQHGMAGAKYREKDALGFKVLYFGTPSLRDLSYQVRYARVLAKKLRLGIGIQAMQLLAGEYGNTTTLDAELGIQYDLTKKITASTHIINPFRARKEDRFNLRSEMAIGIRYSPSKTIQAFADLRSDRQFEYQGHFGFRYMPISMLSVMGGLETGTGSWSFGLGLKVKKNWSIESAVVTHPILPLRSTIGLNYFFLK